MKSSFQDSSLASSLSGVFATLSQTQRFLQVHFPPSAPEAVRRLVPLQVEGEEAVCGGVRFRLQCVGDDVQLPLKDLIGLPIGFSVGNDAGERSVVCGLISRCEHRFAEGATPVLEIEACDALSLLQQRRTWRIFRDESTVGVIKQILSEHIHENPILARAFDYTTTMLYKKYPARSFLMQCEGESDENFIVRGMQSEGTGHYFLHGIKEGDPVHTLVFADDIAAYGNNPVGTVRYDPEGLVREKDTVTSFHAWRTLAPSRVDGASSDYKAVRNTEASENAWLEQGQAGGLLARTLTDYLYDAPHFGANPAHYAQQNTSRLLAHEYAAKGFRGTARIPQLRSGTVIELADHPEIDRHPPRERRFTLTRTAFYARNNIRLDARLDHALFQGWEAWRNKGEGGGGAPAQAPRSLADAPVFECEFDCVRYDTPIVPIVETGRIPRVSLLSAVVVGDQGRPVDIDKDARIPVRFLFARDEEHTHGYGTSGTARDSARIRVAQPWAHNGYGTSYWPRPGTEILIGFIQGHPDKPVALWSVFNGRNVPVRFSGYGSLPANAALTGIRTQELGGKLRHNQLCFDDTTGQLSAQLASEHYATQLNQGWLGKPRNEGRSEPRGEGFEQITDAAGAIRAARGLLLSAFARLNASGHQLAREETLALMEEITALFKQLGQAAAAHEGLAVDTAPHETLHQQFKDWENGSNTAPNASGGGAPLAAITAPAGVLLSTPETVVTHAGKNVDTVALKNLQLTSAERLIANAGRGISLFAHSGDCRVIANQGKVCIQSQAGDTLIQSAKNVSISASDGTVEILSATKIVLGVVGGGCIQITKDGIIQQCPGIYHVQAGDHLWDGPASGGGQLPIFSQDAVGREPGLARATDSQPIAGAHYRMEQADGSIVSGVTDVIGIAKKSLSEQFEHRNIAYFSSAASGMAAGAAGSAAANAQGEVPHDEQFVVLDENQRPVPNFSYQAVLADGQTIFGITDAEGRSERITTGNAPIKIQFVKNLGSKNE